jgi:hypothetical protein
MAFDSTSVTQDNVRRAAAVALGDSGGPLHVVAMPGTAAHPLAVALAQAFGSSIAGHPTQPCGVVDLAELAGRSSGARFVALIDDPARQIAQALHSGAAVAPVLDEWRTAARHLLRAVQAAPHRFLCIDLAEAEAWPDMLSVQVGSWARFGNPPAISVPDRARTPESDAIARMLARGRVDTDKAIASLRDELLACCVVLADEAAAACRPDAAAAIDEYGTARTRLREALSDASARQVENEKLRGELSASKLEAETLVQQLHQLQEELEQAFLKRESDTARDSEAVAVREDKEQLLRELSASRRENDIVLLQLHQLQEELEDCHLASREGETVHLDTGREGTLPLRLGRTQTTHRRDEPPHRHLQLRIEDVPALGGQWPVLDLRLVEHHGRPGLVLFADETGRKPLSAWQPSGREGEREFMLMVPSDSQGLRLLQPMGSADWQLVTGLTAHVQRRVRGEPDLRPWPTVATRLCRQLADLPRRLRYDRLDVKRAESDPRALEACFGACTFGDLHLDELKLRWDAIGGLLHWEAPADALQMPLSNWPVGADGQLVPSLALPVSQPSAAQRLFWAGLGGTDCELVLAVLDALPAVAERVADADLPAGTGRAELVRVAAAGHRDARRFLSSLRWRRVARRLLRRTS